jgi:hypothetical protein
MPSGSHGKETRHLNWGGCVELLSDGRPNTAVPCQQCASRELLVSIQVQDIQDLKPRMTAGLLSLQTQSLVVKGPQGVCEGGNAFW